MSGPHSLVDLQRWWFEAGCGADGTAYPGSSADQSAWWNAQTVAAVKGDMACYRKHANAGLGDYAAKAGTCASQGLRHATPMLRPSSSTARVLLYSRKPNAPSAASEAGNTTPQASLICLDTGRHRMQRERHFNGWSEWQAIVPLAPEAFGGEQLILFVTREGKYELYAVDIHNSGGISRRGSGRIPSDESLGQWSAAKVFAWVGETPDHKPYADAFLENHLSGRHLEAMVDSAAGASVASSPPSSLPPRPPLRHSQPLMDHLFHDLGVKPLGHRIDLVRAWCCGAPLHSPCLRLHLDLCLRLCLCLHPNGHHHLMY